MVVQERDITVIQETIKGNGDIFDIVVAIKQCNNYHKAVTLDVVLITLPTTKIEYIKEVIARTGKNFTLDDLGHFSLLLGYLYKTVDDIRYSTPEDLGRYLSELREDMVRQGKTILYHLCLEQDTDALHPVLKKEGFNAYVTPRQK